MAARKKSSSTGDLFATASSAPEPVKVIGSGEDVSDAPKLRVVPLPEATPEEDVVIEPTSDGRFIVSLLRHHGTTAAAVVYTRAQLLMLLRRIEPALEMA